MTGLTTVTIDPRQLSLRKSARQTKDRLKRAISRAKELGGHWYVDFATGELSREPFKEDTTQLAHGWVYFVRAQHSGLIKIGRASDLKTRFRGLVTMSPEPLTLAAICPGAEHERGLHHRFAGDRAHGEWFKATPRLLAYVETARNNYGLPEWAL